MRKLTINRQTTPCCKAAWLWAQKFGMRTFKVVDGRKIYSAQCEKCSVDYELDGGKDGRNEAVCLRCNSLEHDKKDCDETRLAKIWPSQFVFRGTIRTPLGTKVTLEMPLGERGQSLLNELTMLCVTGGDKQ